MWQPQPTGGIEWKAGVSGSTPAAELKGELLYGKGQTAA